MRTIPFLRLFSLCISFSLLVAPLPLPAIAHELITNLSGIEAEVINNSTDLYVYLGEELSDIIDVIAEISRLDVQKNSPIAELNSYVAEGFLIAEQSAVIEALEYGAGVLQKNAHRLDIQKKYALQNTLKRLLDKIITGSLTLPSKNISEIQDWNGEIDLLKTRSRKKFIIDRYLKVKNRSYFKKHIKARKGIRCGGHLKVGKNSKFKKNVKVNNFHPA